jgi:hypothetical protein
MSTSRLSKARCASANGPACMYSTPILRSSSRARQPRNNALSSAKKIRFIPTNLWQLGARHGRPARISSVASWFLALQVASWAA